MDLYTSSVFLIIMLSGTSSLTITETAEGCHYTLSCQNTTGNDTVVWFRNNLEIIQTSTVSNGYSRSFPDLQDGAKLDVSVSNYRHSLTMEMYLHNGETSWRCETVNEVSKNLTLKATNLTKDSGIPYNLMSVPATAAEGRTFTLSCTHASGFTIGTALWYRNCVQIFQTNGRDQKNQMLSKMNDRFEFRAVSQRISVASDLTRHSVFLTLNATLDEGSVWTCGSGQRFSNSITVKVMEYVTEESSSSVTSTDGQANSHQTTDGHETDRQTTSAVDKKDDRPSGEGYLLLYAIAGSAGGLLLLMGLITVCIISRRTSGIDSSGENMDFEPRFDVYAGIRDNHQESSDSKQQPRCLVLTNVMLQGNENLQYSDKQD
ncbi:uncharacterized protein LOC124265038 [Haliotis rubra]|uniref:uncharacterized protein LOC124265038 n=1 Tax=Haliotis rubra TaxID=36100 RepID=UPI001EE4FCD2|nr:uncharacterized protein LOC124265038 [Haliotis rubra]